MDRPTGPSIDLDHPLFAGLVERGIHTGDVPIAAVTDDDDGDDDVNWDDDDGDDDVNWDDDDGDDDVDWDDDDGDNDVDWDDDDGDNDVDWDDGNGADDTDENGEQGGSVFGGNPDIDDLPTVSCSRCDRVWTLGYELDDLQVGNRAIEQFALDHQRHTGHYPDDVCPWVADCRQCPETESFLAERPAHRYAEVHARHTGHPVDIDPPEAPLRTITPDAVR